MKLFIITQAVDSTHSALGFFIEWIKSLRRHPSISSVTVASFDDSNEKIENVDIHRIHKTDRLARIKSLWSLLKTSDWDVLFVHMTPIWCIACWPIVFIKRKKMVLWYTHGSSSFALRLACLLCDEVYTATNSAFPFRSKKVFAIGHGVPESFAGIQRTLDSHHRYLANGRFSRRKRVIETLEFFEQIHQMDPQATLTWVGSSMGDKLYELEIEQTIHHLKLESCVQMKGAVLFDDLPEIYASHDLLLHLSATGSLDKVAIEALATGCAVFSTNPATGDGLGKEWLWEGILDAFAVTEVMQRAKQGVSSETRQRIAHRYSLTIFVDRLCKMLSGLVGKSMS